MNSVLVASDLDRTLIYSAKAFFLDVPDHLAPDMVVAELHEGVPISFMTRTAERLLLELTRTTIFVPVTTRTEAQYRRVRLPGAVPEYAVTTNGGVLLKNGEPDIEWQTTVGQRVSEGSAPLAVVEEFLSREAYRSWILRLRRAEELFLYAMVDRELMPVEFVRDLDAWCASLGWTVSVQGRKLYCVPHAVTKNSAVAEVARRTGASRVIAAGDSLLDGPMLAEADVAFRPSHGELAAIDFRRHHLRVTDARGILAGEEISRRIHALVQR
ncbi:HAD family hydrolase [Arthrobacter sp. Y81]|uniref:HAD family hydrolase n=1 Tax=Arthrobacter sp. Y81 TaxID=2058897 RepID=UPI000CE56C74|nr:HAD family hydrolase [Arthrobacter sp. Y81]